MGLAKKSFTVSDVDYYMNIGPIRIFDEYNNVTVEDPDHLWVERVDDTGGAPYNIINDTSGTSGTSGGSSFVTSNTTKQPIWPNRQIADRVSFTNGVPDPQISLGKRIAIKTDSNGCANLSISIAQGKVNGTTCQGAKYFVGKVHCAISSSYHQAYNVSQTSIAHAVGNARGGHTPDRGMKWTVDIGNIDHVDEVTPTTVYISSLGPTTLTSSNAVQLLPGRWYYLWIWPEPDRRYDKVIYNGTQYNNEIDYSGTITLTPSGSVAKNTMVAASDIKLSSISGGSIPLFGEDLRVDFADMAIEPTIFAEPNHIVPPDWPGYSDMPTIKGAIYNPPVTYEVTASMTTPGGSTYTETLFNNILPGKNIGVEDFDENKRLTLDIYGPYDPVYYDDDFDWRGMWPFEAAMECIKWKPSLSVYGPMFNDRMDVSITISVKIYYSSSSTSYSSTGDLVGTSSKQFTIRFPDTVKPVGISDASSFEPYNSSEDKVGWADGMDLVIQNHSRIKAMFDRAAVAGIYNSSTGEWEGGTWVNKYGAYLTKWVYSVMQNGQTKNYEYALTSPDSYTSFSISDKIATDASVKITVWDSRGNYVEAPASFSITPFYEPSIEMSSGSIVRSAREIDDTVTPPVITDRTYESEDGRFMSVNIKGRFPSIAGLNILTVKIATKRHSEADSGNIDTWPRVDVFAYPSSSGDQATQLTPAGIYSSSGNDKMYLADVTLGKNYMYDHTNGVLKTTYVTMGESGGVMTFITENTRNYEAAASATGYEDYTYDVWVQLEDRLGYKADFRGQMYSAKWAMKFMDDASGVAFGKSAEFSNRLEIPDTWDFYTGDSPVVSTKRKTGSLELTEQQKQNARSNIGMLRFIDVQTPSSWSADPQAISETYPYRVAIPLIGVTENDIPDVYFSPAQLEAGELAPFAISYGDIVAATGLPANNGGVYLYAESNIGQIIVPVIQFN